MLVFEGLYNTPTPRPSEKGEAPGQNRNRLHPGQVTDSTNPYYLLPAASPVLRISSIYTSLKCDLLDLKFSIPDSKMNLALKM